MTELSPRTEDCTVLKSHVNQSPILSVLSHITQAKFLKEAIRTEG